MGTRGLTVITQDGQIKLSNYRQWDSYFEVGGVELLEFCRKYLKEKRQIEAFKNKVKLLKDISKDTQMQNEINEVLAKFQENPTYCLGMNQIFPQFSRDTGIKILEIINDLVEYEFGNKKYPVLIDTDIMGIEYINVIDLDNNRIYLLRYETRDFKSLPTNSIIEETFIQKGYECFLSYQINKVPSITTATKDYKKTLNQALEEVPF